MNEAEMNKDSKPGALRSTGKNGEKRNISGPFGSENFIFIFWAAISFVTIYVLMLDERLVDFLSDANKVAQESIFIFSKINERIIFNSNLANAHFFLMSLCIPIQLIMLFMVPDAGIASGARKNKRGLLWVTLLFAFLLAIILIIGPAVAARYSRIFGEKLIISLSDYAITIGFSYLIRVASIALSSSNGSETC